MPLTEEEMSHCSRAKSGHVSWAERWRLLCLPNETWEKDTLETVYQDGLRGAETKKQKQVLITNKRVQKRSYLR